MIKSGLASTAYEREFIRQALFEDSIRLDGRGVDDYRELMIKLERSESSSTSEIQLGSTLVVTVITGEIVTPFPDRPVEGILQFSAHVSPHTELAGTAPWELTRMLERALKDSEALDTESLCIVGGERVWQINCNVNVLDGSGGNVIDACLLSVISALKAFRKPDVSVVPANIDETADKPTKGFNLPLAVGTARPNVNILVHHSNNREPLPLSLHHTPITVTLGIFRGRAAGRNGNGAAAAVAAEQSDQATNVGALKTILLTDPSLQEEGAMDGRITFSINAHNELCALNKPAGRGLTASAVVQAAKIASARAAFLHQRLSTALAELEERVKVERGLQLEVMQRYNQQVQKLLRPQDQGLGTAPGAVGAHQERPKERKEKQAVGIDRNDPILQWSSLHQAAGLWE